MLDRKYDFKEIEEGKCKKWEELGYFKSGNLEKLPFSMVMPPPNVTGNLHIGHALDGTIQDIIIRYKRMCGFDTLWLPGMDHAAIATESKVVNKLKNLGIDKYELGREGFLKECFKWKDEHADNIRNQWNKLGFSPDYTKERFTMDKQLNHAVNTVFVDLYNKGLIYKGLKIINWDTIARTALSNEEVIYREVNGKLYYLKYKLAESDDYILVATTRPETIFGDVAVCVNNEDEKYFDIVGKEVIVPLVNRKVKVIGDRRVLKDFGTGALKITPAHSSDDYDIGLDYNLEIINTINPDGKLNELTGIYNGLEIIEARKQIVQDLEKLNLIEKVEDYVHSVGFSERTDAVVEPYLSEQWFVKMESMAENLLKNQETTDKINFYPNRFEKILTHWMSNCHDWCISRQLWWGHRIPVWYKNDEIYVGVDEPKEEGWTQDNDVLDTWFSSALWAFSTLGWPLKTDDLERYFKTNVLVSGYDIIFFWIARMAFSSIEQMKESPFKDCVIHGLVRDKQGRKMSKSLGNGVDPLDMISKYGTDSLRFYLTTTGTMGSDLNFDEERLVSTGNFINKLWNASKFVLMNVENTKDLNINYDNLKYEDKWILTEFNTTLKSITESMEKYRFNDVGSLIYDFTWNKFCDWYIELSKGSDNVDSKKVLLKILTNILKILHPFMPFVTEEIYLNLPIHDESIMISDYPKYNEDEIFTEIHKLISESITEITNIRNFKKDNNITKDNYCSINIDDNLKDLFIRMLKLNVLKQDSKIISYKSGLVSVDFYINEEDESELISKTLEEIDNLEKSILKREKLLSNENYVLKAPKNIVDLDKEKLSKEKELLNILKDKIKKV